MLPWGGLSCCLSGAALYLLGRSSGRDAEILKSATRINQLKELAKLLDSECRLPLVVAVLERVSSETPVKCITTFFLKHNDAGSWIQDYALMLSMSKEVPWYLVRRIRYLHVPSCAYRVNIIFGSLGAEI